MALRQRAGLKQIKPRGMNPVTAIAESSIVIKAPGGNHLRTGDAEQTAVRRSEASPEMRFLAPQQRRKHLAVPFRIMIHVRIESKNQRYTIKSDPLRSLVMHVHMHNQTIGRFFNAISHFNRPEIGAIFSLS